MSSSSTKPPYYGTIPSSNPASLPRASKLRPWRHLLDPHSLSAPFSYPDALSRARKNLRTFRYNYTLLILLVAFLSLLYHPYSLIVFLLSFLAWLVLYFSRDQNAPLVVFNYVIGDGVVFGILGLGTVVALVCTGVGLNVLVALVVGFVVVGLHSTFWGTEDGWLDEEDAAEGGLLSVVGGGRG